jgi:hypothetical protein
MRFSNLIALTVAALAAAPAYAEVKLHNKDSKAHRITVKCTSTVQRSIQPNTVTSLGKGPCTVTVKATGAKMTGSGNDTLVISKP